MQKKQAHPEPLALNRAGSSAPAVAMLVPLRYKALGFAALGLLALQEGTAVVVAAGGVAAMRC